MKITLKQGNCGNHGNVTLIFFIRFHVIEKLRKATDEKVVAIFSPVGNVGLDVFVHHLINCSGGKDPNMTIQKVGRGLRKAPDKEVVDYHDFC